MGAPAAIIPVGRYRFQFRVLVPSILPVENYWHLAFCSTADCLSVNDPSVIVSFVLNGFLLGEASSASLDGTTDGALRSGRPWGAAWASIALLFLLLRAWTLRE